MSINSEVRLNELKDSLYHVKKARKAFNEELLAKCEIDRGLSHVESSIFKEIESLEQLIRM